MAQNLLSAGHELTVYNRTRARAEPLREQGARVAESPAEAAQGNQAVITMLRALVEHFTDRPNGIAGSGSPVGVAAGSDEAMRAAVTYVAGMTDRFACLTAVSRLGWDPARLPHSVGAT